MARKKEPESWADRLDSPEQPSTQTEQNAKAPPPSTLGLEATLSVYEQEGLKARCLDLEIRNKELELGLHLAKAKICEFELKELQAKKG